MIDTDRLYLTGSVPVCDWELASRCIEARPGVCYVEMDPPPTHYGTSGLEIPDGSYRNDAETGFEARGQTRRRMRPDIGTVLTCGFDLDKRWGSDAPVLVFGAGNRVLVCPQDGIWIEDGHWGEYEARSEVRIYGWAKLSDESDLITRQPFSRSILATIERATNDGYQVTRTVWEDGKAKQITECLLPYGDNIIIRRDAQVKAKSGIHLPDELRYREATGTLMAVGPFIQDVLVGCRIHYFAHLLKQFTYGGDEDVAIGPASAILAVIG